jgi:uncharacterized membrane protein
MKAGNRQRNRPTTGSNCQFRRTLTRRCLTTDHQIARTQIVGNLQNSLRHASATICSTCGFSSSRMLTMT